MARRGIVIFGLLLAGNIAAWLWALAAFHGRPAPLAAAVLAYSFGLRHAFDADHIAAIDNVTRKLMQNGQQPIGVGFFFSLGHSSVVVGLSLAIALTTTIAQRHFTALKEVGAIVGTSVSALFLLAIATANAVVLIQIAAAFRRAEGGARMEAGEVDAVLDRRGFLGRLLRPAFALVNQSWQMYPLGLLFGLGFDTATEVGLLGISASQAAHGLPVWSILVFPTLFTAGMTLTDTTDGLLMVGAYGWASVRPLRKLYYNMTITFASILVALAVGGVEALGLIGDRLRLGGPFWSFVGWLNGNFGFLGYAIVGFFIVGWVASILFYKMRGYDSLDASA
ncbi:MAG TPA: HoxN/HupN/NixA family nickel/cobalt transporter [Stellaceae bacterium]|jgi:high-affinity nickel-transport protein|nr:HoxN/HupN/NixA family nickel/cobalt transporter [Stellaceae bacterium]